MIGLRQWVVAFAMAGMLAVTVPVVAQSKPELLKDVKVINNDAAANEFLDYYYLHPRPELTASAMQYYSRTHMLDRETLLAPFSGFFAQVFRANPKVAEQCAKELTSPAERKLLVFAIWFSQLDSAADLLTLVGKDASADIKALVKNFTYQVPPDMLTQEIRSPDSLNALWGAFFATGDRRWVERIISVLPWTEEKDDQARTVIGNSAEYSLTTNANKHKSVRAILEQNQKTAPEAQRRFIAEVLRKADEKTSTP